MSNTDTAPYSEIVVIDSGVGGLSVCQSIFARCDRLKIVYLADNACFPYGVKPEEQLQERVFELVEQLLSLHKPKLIVLACNTISTLLLPLLRSRFEIPFVGVVPAIKPAAEISQSKKIGILATPETVKRSYLDALINEFAQECEVTKVGSEELVRIAENWLVCGELDSESVRNIIEPFKSHGSIDTVVLGCTHFPLMRKQLEQMIPAIKWVDSGDAIARRVEHLLTEHDKSVTNISENISRPSSLVYFTGDLPNLDSFSASLSGLGFSDFELARL